LQGKRAALGVVMVVAVVFIGMSAVQIVPAIFRVGVTPLPAPGQDANAAACAVGIRDRLGRTASPELPDEEQVRSACEKSPAGLDAWASLARLRSAERQLDGTRPEELDPLRRDVAAHLPADLR
jgi:hypothetical protein